MNSDTYDSDSESPKRGSDDFIERWRASESPKESFSDAEGANEDGEWGFQIISEEVRHDGKISFEVLWDGWRRADGTRTTWYQQDDSDIDSKPWTAFQKKERDDKASESMEVEIMTTTDIHNNATFLRSQAFEEKLKKAQKGPQPNWVEETAKLMAKHQGHVHPSGSLQLSTQGSSARTSQRASTRQRTEGSYTSLSSSTVRGSSKLSGRSSVTLGAVQAPTPPAPSLLVNDKTIPRQMPSPAVMSEKARGKQREKNSPSPTTSLPFPKPSPPDPPFILLSPQKRVKRVISLRLQLQQEWSRIAESHSAAKITFVNEVDDEAIPQLDPSFRYLERSYEYAPGIDLPDTGFLLICSCRSCEEPTECECQESSEFVDEMGRPMHAYTQTGLFAFNVPKNLEVVECNQASFNYGCRCSLSTCKNRVSQRPRDVPIEIFKTRNRGWGARATVAVKRGKPLGIYTGRRIDARKLPAPLDAYTFDLDGDEWEDNQSTHEKYTEIGRDLSSQSTFTFIFARSTLTLITSSHSCRPNLQIYLVVHDTPTNTGMPYIVFVAAKDIPARTEFTFDYNPAAAMAEEAARAKTKKGKALRIQLDRPEGREDCFCDSTRCRGFV
ncbi:hypothetical protein M413DRAFT_65153 [Hebeloma cylindrosporum]|uniref:SET domain-containing protein n=1 Tax=Hebeloma cylindrosporum TaxID=76867 RepID=A0A0C2Y9S7_HEBCY|nr:hypothetical protein M413DRAFT_65153 [Hebeloma cylindrosporum h7]